ncbi:MAG: proline racemase family protein [Litoreibacter sp.]
MKITKTLQVIDYHAAGEPMRIYPTVIRVPGETMMDKYDYACQHLDGLRRFMAHEPRGHSAIMGCILTEPVNEGSLFGVLFFDTTIFNAACGHGSIVLATAAVEQGWITPVEGENSILFDIPLGQIEMKTYVEDGEVVKAIYRGVPSFVHEQDVTVETSVGPVKLDIAFGGVFFAIIDTAQFGPEPPDRAVFLQLYAEIKSKLDATGTVVLADQPSIRDIDGVHFITMKDRPGFKLAWRADSIFSGGTLDRSPCGTGTCATLANFYNKGVIGPDEPIFAESAPGEHFQSKIVAIDDSAGRTTVTSDIWARGYLTGYNNLVATDGDPLAGGFVV